MWVTIILDCQVEAIVVVGGGVLELGDLRVGIEERLQHPLRGGTLAGSRRGANGMALLPLQLLALLLLRLTVLLLRAACPLAGLLRAACPLRSLAGSRSNSTQRRLHCLAIPCPSDPS